jgi:hypothetical protein
MQEITERPLNSPLRSSFPELQFRMQEYVSVLAACGVTFRGIQRGPREAFILFHDPGTSSTLAVRESEFSHAAVLHRLNESRSEFTG